VDIKYEACEERRTKRQGEVEGKKRVEDAFTGKYGLQCV